MPTNGGFVVAVPARLASTRLPNKALADIGGTPMIVRVLRAAAAAGATQVFAAVDAAAVAAAVRDAGYLAVMTGECDSGGARLAAALQQLPLSDDTVVVNVQGDEPFIEPAIIRDTAALLLARPDCVCATPCRPPADIAEFQDEAAVKVVADKDGTARYFSRAPLPHRRGGGTVSSSSRVHIGIYAYRAGYLRHLPMLSPSPLEQLEQLEQLRILWHGGKIALLEVKSDSFGIDTAADLTRARRRVSA